MESKIGEGSIVRDKLSGFQGTVVAKVEYYTTKGIQFLIVSSSLEKGEPVEKWIEAARLEAVN